jgi:C6 transcription factor Pro1
MDGGLKQAEMSEQVKREIKIKARRRRGEPMFQILDGFTIMPSNLHEVPAANHPEVTEPSSQASMLWLQQGFQQEHSSQNTQDSQALEGSNTVLSLFYLEKVLPFLFPFYSPSLLQGGKAWILEMAMKRPAVRQAILCQSFYFSLACTTAVSDASWEEVLTQTKSTFWTLRESLKVIDNLDIVKNLGCTVRVMTSIMQVHRFEITILSFANWQTHLNAVVGLFRQLLDSDSSFSTIMNRLDPPVILPVQNARLPNAEQAAFRFSSTLVIWDDIIASTILQKQPRLYNHHHSLLCSDIEGIDPPINIETVFGVKNWALLRIGEIAFLDAWKLECKKAGSLDVMKLAHRATTIKESLIVHLTELENKPINKIVSSLDIFTPSNLHSSHRSLITVVWAHAALLYLFIVTSGWQPANDDVRYHVSRIVKLLSCPDFPPALLRTVVWPCCVAGCLAEPTQETQFRQMIERLKPSNLFGNVYKALEVMENAWKNRTTGEVADRDLATCFRNLEDLTLPV